MIDLSRPIKGEWRGRGFGRRYVWIYECDKCSKQVLVRASSFAGKHSVPGIGGIYCECDAPKKEETD